MHHGHAPFPGRIGRLVRTSLRAVVAGLLIWSCVPPPPGFPPYVPPPPPPVPPEPVRLPDRLDTDSLLSWAVEEERVLVVDKSCQLLQVYDYGRLVRSYPIVSARRDGRKLYEGDKRTPIGLYMIIGKRRHPRWSRFMLLDYPTPSDVARHRHHLKTGQLPGRNGSLPGPGGEIGLHGTDHAELNKVGVNWTLGCISLSNPDIRELYRTTPEGTLVYIKE